MPATPKNSRQLTGSYINEYTLNIVNDGNVRLTSPRILQRIPSLFYTGSNYLKSYGYQDQVPQLQYDPSQGGTLGLAGSTGITNTIAFVEPQTLPIPIGFDFPINNSRYSHMIISQAGYVIVGSPQSLQTHVSSSLWAPQLLLENGTFRARTSNQGCNFGINLTGSFNGALIAPWFCNVHDPRHSGPTTWDFTIATPMNLVDTLSGSGATYENMSASLYGYTTYPTVDEIATGRANPPMDLYAPASSGIRWRVLDSTTHGKSCVIQWNVRLHNAQYNTAIPGSLRFELALFESGRMEFKYDHFRQPSSLYVRAPHWASIGVFTNYGFRDFAGMLPTYVDARTKYALGGVNTIVPGCSIISMSFGLNNRPTAVTSSFVTNLNALSHWPAQGDSSFAFVFQPPQRQRMILPRIQSQLDGIASSDGIFDDRNIVIASENAIVHYPSKMIKGQQPATLAGTTYLDLTSNGILATGSTNSDIDAYKLAMSDKRTFKHAPAFEEHNRQILEEETTSNGTFFANVGADLPEPLKAKNQINIELPIDYTTRMLGLTSSIMYYNTRYKQFLIKNPSDLVDPQEYANNQQMPEDYRGFGPFGNLLVSGSRNPTIIASEIVDPGGENFTINFKNSTDDLINGEFNAQQYSDAIQKEYAKSICINQEYNASNDETFTLAITEPFLIEAAIIELPIEAGASWFSDITRMNNVISYFPTEHHVDCGGPAVTVALFGESTYDNNKRRQLILSATFTHENDVNGLNTRKFNQYCFATATLYTNVQYAHTDLWGRIEGINAFTSINTSSIIQVPANNQFTGSVRLLTTPTVTNGVVGSSLITFNFYDSGVSPVDVEKLLKDTPLLKMDVFGTIYDSNVGGPSPPGPHSQGSTAGMLLYPGSELLFPGISVGGLWHKMNLINNIGRNQDGFVGCGNAIFGREQITKRSPREYVNLYHDLMQESGFTWASKYVNLPQPINSTQTVASPFLVMPGQKLTLAVSKTRPCIQANRQVATSFYSNNEGRTFLSLMDYSVALQEFFNDGHDIKIPSGSSVKITLFGSYLHEAKEFHDIRNTKLQSTMISDVIGNDPILDQFEVHGRHELFGSYNDAYVTGSMTLQQRNRQFNMSTATHQQLYSTIDPSQWYYDDIMQRDVALKQQFEFAGLLNHIRMSTAQIIYDSFVPSLSDLFNITNFPLANVADATTEATEFGGISGILWSWNSLPPATPGSVTTKTTDTCWQFSFPFESAYSSVNRSIDPFVSVYDTNRYWANSLYNLNGLAPDYVGSSVLQRTSKNVYVYYGGWANTSPTGFYDPRKYEPLGAWWYRGGPGTVNISNDELRKIIFGFGDLNNIALGTKIGNDFSFRHPIYGEKTIPTTLQYVTTDSIRCGANHLPHFKQVDPYGLNTVHGSIIRGWKYGLFSGIPTSTSLVFRRSHYGQFRDMLEQSIDTKLFVDNNVGDSPVQVRFVNPITNQRVDPLTTWSSNMSFEATSSLPYFDGDARNRPDINPLQLNQTLQSITTDSNGNLVI